MDNWKACPLSVSLISDFNISPTIALYQILPVQTNGHDCGVWALACIAAVLRGNHLPDVREHNIGEVRTFLYCLALSLPACNVPASCV